MKTNLFRRGIAVVLAGVLAATTVNVNITRADETVTTEEKYADILGLYKTVDETIELLIERADNDELEYRTYFVKSEDEELDTDWWSNIVNKSSGEYITLNFEPYNDCTYTFSVGDYYYHTIRIGMARAYETSEEKKEYEEKVKYVEETLGLVSEEMCDYEKAAIIYKYIVENVAYGAGLYNGKSSKEWADEIGWDGFEEILRNPDTYYEPVYDGQTAYEALINKTAVCGGYARLYNSMIADMKINCIWMIGTGWTTNHSFNLVELGDTWYYCDPTNGIWKEYEEGYWYLANFLFGNKYCLSESMYLLDNNSKEAMKYYNCSVSEDSFPVVDYGDYNTCAVIFNVNEYTAPTCTSTGVFDIDCDYCSDHHVITIPVTHYYTYTTNKEPTCLEEGSGTATCTLCGDTYDYIIPADGHKWTYRSVEMDCETDGYEKVYCEDCDEVYWNVEEPMCGHNWTEWEDASVMQYKRTCLNCRDVQYEYKSVIDGTEEPTTASNVSEEDKTPMDRGYGVIAYYNETSHGWVYYDTKWECYLPAYEATEIWSDKLGENVYWDESAHTFITFEEYLAKLNQGSEKDNTTSADPTTTTKTVNGTTTNKPTANSESDSNKGNHVGQKPTAVNTSKAEETVKAPGKVKIKTFSKKKNTTKKVSLKFEKIKKAAGYQIVVYTKKKYAKKNKLKKAYVNMFTDNKTKKAKAKTKTVSITDDRFKNKKIIFVKMRAYNVNNKGKFVYGKWSDVIKVTVKK